MQFGIMVLFVVFCILMLGVLLVCLLTPALFYGNQPKTKKKVIELTCDGWLARKLIDRGWGASTIPLPFIVFILYWVYDSASENPDPYVRVHEFVHVKQDEDSAFFLMTWIKYFSEIVRERIKTGSMMQAYRDNKYEVEAYKVEDEASVNMPDWAK